MQLYLSQMDLGRYTARQIDTFFPCCNYTATHQGVCQSLQKALDRVEYCFSKIKNKYYHKDGQVCFSPLMTDQYASFLYFLANTVFESEGCGELADRIYGLNKALHSVDIYYEVKLPRVFFLIHSVGTVLGRATYGEYFAVYQGVTVGGNLDYEYPEIHEGVSLFSNCSVVGRSVLNPGVCVAARSSLMNMEIPENHICFGQHPHVEVKAARRAVSDLFFERESGVQ